MTPRIRIRLRQGEREIELSAPRSDVDELLHRWWRPSDAPEETQSRSSGSTRTSRPTQRKVRPGVEPAAKAEGADAPDVNAIANQIKRDSRFALARAKFQQSKDLWNKIECVLSLGGQALSSGELVAVLKALGFPAALPRVSEKLGAHIHDLSQTGERRRGANTRYEITPAARDGFLSSLESDG